MSTQPPRSRHTERTNTHTEVPSSHQTAPQTTQHTAQSPQTAQSMDSRRFIVEGLLNQALHSIQRSRPMPFSTSVMINGEELVALLQRALAALPDEVKAARWVLKEREQIKMRAEREGSELVARARAQAERMVQRSEVVKTAEMHARRTTSNAEEHAAQLRLETEDWCDKRLAAFESALQKTMRTVAAGRRKLQDTRTDRPPEAEPRPAALRDGFFDQDLG